jgi:hypothetical protein
VTEEDGARDVDKAVGELGVRPPVLGLLFDEQALVLPEINLEGFGFAGDEGRRGRYQGCCRGRQTAGELVSQLVCIVSKHLDHGDGYKGELTPTQTAQMNVTYIRTSIHVRSREFISDPAASMTRPTTPRNLNVM